MSRDFNEDEIESLRALKQLRPPSDAEQLAVAAAMSSMIEAKLKTLDSLRSLAPAAGSEDRAVERAVRTYRARRMVAALKGQRIVPANDNPSFRRLAAAAALLLVMGGALGWGVRHWSPIEKSTTDIIVASAYAAHQLYTGPDAIIQRPSQAHSAALSKWVSDRVGRVLRVDDLGPPTFQLVGGALLPLDASNATAALELVYRNPAQQTVAVHITAAVAGGETMSLAVERGGLKGLFWTNDRITCTVISDLPDGERESVARQFYQKLAQVSDPTYPGRG